MTQDRSFQEHLELLLGKKFRLKINDNHSTMLSVKWEPDCTVISMHRIFLQAPRNVMEKLACYIVSETGSKGMPLEVKSFIDHQLERADYSYTVDEKKLVTRGKKYDLKSIYQSLNEEYFKGELNELKITWFKARRGCAKASSQISLGLYHSHLKLIKINQILDNSAVPDYVMRFVIYHEMLHAVCPSPLEPNGTRRIHTQQFRLREKCFVEYDQVQDWLFELPTYMERELQSL